MPKRKQGEVDNQGVQDFELIELLIRESVKAGPSTSAPKGSDFESFQARFQSYVDQVPSYLHSVGKEGFFPHFFLGSFSTLIDTEIAAKLNIEKIYFSFDSSKTLKVAVIKKGEIKSPEDAADKVRLFVIAESGSTKKKFSYGELDKILGNTKVARNDVVRLARDQGKLGVRLVEIAKEKDAKGKMAGISVNVESNKLDNDASTTHEFKEIKKGLWSNPENDIAKLTNSNAGKVKESVEEIFKKVSRIHSEYGNSLTYAQGTREAAHHGFVAGALVNFRYRHNLRVYLEQFAGRGYADIVLVPRGKERSLNAVPIIIELKAGTAAGTTLGSALEQAKDYAKGFQPNTMRVLTVSDNVLCVGLNLDSTEGEKFSMHISPREDREIALPTMQALLKEASDWNGREEAITDITEKIKQPLERIYHTFPGTPEKGGNYFSRFLLGQLLLADKFVDIDLEKSVFLYNEYPLASSTRSGTQSTERPVTTFMLTKGNQGQDKEVFIFHIREGGKGEFSEKKIPINLPKVGKITEVCISLQEERKPDFFDIKKIDRYNSLNEYKGGKESFNGEWKNIPYPAELKEKFDAVLESQLASSQDRSQSIGKYKELFGKLGEAMLPFKFLIEKEAHTQAVFHGAFSHYSDIKLGESQENRALVLTEFQTGRGKRIDMVVHGIKFANQASSAKEYDPVGLELKGPREGKTANALKDEANSQITDEYKKGVTYKTLTDGNEVAFMGVVFDKKAKDANSLILASKDEFASVKVVHSSIFSISQQQCSKGRRTRSIGMACIDSRDEEGITKEEKEKRVKELFDADKVVKKAKDIEFYNQLFKISQQVSKGEAIDPNIKKALVTKVKNVVFLNSMDTEIEGIVGENKENIEALKTFTQIDKYLSDNLDVVSKVLGESSSYFLQICKIDLLKIVLPLIKDENFKNLLINNPEKLTKDAELLNDIFTEISEKVSTKYSHSQQLQDADFENLKDEIDQEIFSKQRERVNQIATLDVNKSSLLNHVLESMKLSKVLLSMNQQEINKNLQKMVCYNTLIDLGILVSDHRNYVQTNNLGNLYSLADRVCSSQLLSIAHGLHSLRDEIDINYSKFSDAVMKNYFSDDNIMDFNIEIEAYDKEIVTKEIITIGHDQVFDEIGNADRTDVYVKVKDNNGNDKKLIIGDIIEMKNAERYFVDDYSDGIEILVKVGRNKDHVITEKMEGQDIEYYLNINGYKVKLDNIIKDFTTDVEGEAILDKLHQLSSNKQLLENKKYIEDIGDVQGIETDQGYNDIVEEIKQNLLAKGVREDIFDRFKSHFDDLGGKVFVDYISNVESSLNEKGITFDRNKFDSAKIKGAKGGKFFSMMAIYDLLDSIGDTATLGRYDNDALKQVFGINGILDAMDDVRTSVSISPNSKVGGLINKIPQPVRQAFVKIINNPVVQSITFATIAYQFGYSVDEIVQGNHHPLNYYWTASSGVKLTSMSIRPVSAGVSFAVKSVSTATKILRRLSAAGKVLGRMSVFTMVPDIVFSLHQLLYSRTMEAQAIAAQIPISNIDRTKIFFSNSEKVIYEDYIRIKSYLNTVKSNAISYLNSDPNIVAVVQYVTSIEEKYSEIIKTIEKKHVCVGKGLGCSDQWTCELEKRYESISFNKVNITSNVKDDLSSLNISRPLDLEFYQLDDIGATRFKSIKKYEEFLAKQEKKKVYLISKEAKYLPHITQDEHNSGLRVVMAPSGHLIPQHQCSGIINEERIFRPYALDKVYMPCNAGKTYRNCQESFTLSGEPFIFTSPTRKDPSNTKKQTFPKGSVLYISGPKTLTAAANYPAVMYIPDGNVNYVGSKNKETIFVIGNSISGTLKGGTKKENTLVMNAKANSVIADLHNGTIYYGNSNNNGIRLVNTYNYVSNSDSKQNVTTHCETRFINVKNAEVRQNSFNCTDKDYEVRVVNKENVHHRGSKQTIFVVNKNSDNARIVSDLGSTGKIKGNIDVIRVQVANITQWGISEDIEKVGYSLDLLANDTQSIVSSTKIDDFKNLIIQVNCSGVTESVAIQDKSLFDTVEDIRYQKLKNSGNDISGEVIQNSEKKLKAFIQASILDQELLDTYQIAKDIASKNNFDIPISQIEVTKNHVGIPSEKVIIAGMYSGQVIVDFSPSGSNIANSYQEYRGNGGELNYNNYIMACSHPQDVTVEGGNFQHKYIIKLPEYDHELSREISSSPIRLNLKIKNKVIPYQSIPYDIIDFAELNVTDIDSIGIEEGERSYINECYNQSISDLTEDSLEIQDITIFDIKGTKWSLSIGLVDYFQNPENQQIVLQMNNELYKIDSTNLRLEHVEMNPDSFRYYQPEEQGLQIYHNQPIDKNDIGLVDFRDKSILDFDTEITDDSLVLSHKNHTLAKVENWNTYQPAREMIFAFNDAIVSNSKCIASICNSEDIIVEFNKEKEQKKLDKELSYAVQDGDFNKVQGLVNRGANVNAKDKDGKTPLHYASQSFHHLDIVKYLISKGADIDVKDNSGSTPEDEEHYTNSNTMRQVFMQAHLDKELLLTVKNEKDLKTINDLIAKDIDDRTHGGFYYTWSGNLGTVEFLVSKDVSVNATDKYGCTLLHWSALKGHSDIAKFLVDKGANMNAKDVLGRTPMHFAVMNNHKDIQDVYGRGLTYTTAESNDEEIVQLFLMKGASINEVDKNGETPLHLASWGGHFDILQDLINNGANIGAKDSSGKTSLDIARDKGHNNLVQYLQQTQLTLDKQLLIAIGNSDLNKVRGLVAQGANIDTNDKNGNTLLYSAAEIGDLNLVKLLLDNGANIEAKNGEYQATPLHGAVENYRIDVVKLLLNRGANVNAEDKDNWTPLHYAADTNSLDIVKVLVDAHANLDARSDYGKAPLDIAKDKGHSSIVNYLKERLEEERSARRERRHLPSESLNSVASSGTRSSSWINGLCGWAKEKGGKLASDLVNGLYRGTAKELKDSKLTDIQMDSSNQWKSKQPRYDQAQEMEFQYMSKYDARKSNDKNASAYSKKRGNDRQTKQQYGSKMGNEQSVNQSRVAGNEKQQKLGVLHNGPKPTLSHHSNKNHSYFDGQPKKISERKEHIVNYKRCDDSSYKHSNQHKPTISANNKWSERISNERIDSRKMIGGANQKQQGFHQNQQSSHSSKHAHLTRATAQVDVPSTLFALNMLAMKATNQKFNNTPLPKKIQKGMLHAEKVRAEALGRKVGERIEGTLWFTK
ncbi:MULTISPECIES: ankyrin repeat domain-containing protein [unclassified Wolbachia]|uniref:ankyrin repeat domain-containing protein n=1 Tax=unclassified Wolbachia TaxID=2640676 RepID=UPI00222E21A6|nr:ankyrin repeat domain-containing protein [Wolbachia endosymbiont (group A) of Apoderus coryli]